MARSDESIEFVCADDTEAIEQAKHLFDGHDIKLCQLDRPKLFRYWAKA